MHGPGGGGGLGAWSGCVCMVWGVLGPGGHGLRGVHGLGGMVLGGVPGGDPPDGYCCGRYASYWNAFLLLVRLQPAYSLLI